MPHLPHVSKPSLSSDRLQGPGHDVGTNFSEGAVDGCNELGVLFAGYRHSGAEYVLRPDRAITIVEDLYRNLDLGDLWA